ncbi:hypothetical protein HDU93_007339 [Gonapodya sp. JEL0774]|nr:hypothetical protein HDU93_007339 [Gonapodya sp. JEL0774]
MSQTPNTPHHSRPPTNLFSTTSLAAESSFAPQPLSSTPADVPNGSLADALAEAIGDDEFPMIGSVQNSAEAVSRPEELVLSAAVGSPVGLLDTTTALSSQHLNALPAAARFVTDTATLIERLDVVRLLLESRRPIAVPARVARELAGMARLNDAAAATAVSFIQHEAFTRRSWVTGAGKRDDVSLLKRTFVSSSKPSADEAARERDPAAQKGLFLQYRSRVLQKWDAMMAEDASVPTEDAILEVCLNTGSSGPSVAGSTRSLIGNGNNNAIQDFQRSRSPSPVFLLTRDKRLLQKAKVKGITTIAPEDLARLLHETQLQSQSVERAQLSSTAPPEVLVPATVAVSPSTIQQSQTTTTAVTTQATVTTRRVFGRLERPPSVASDLSQTSDGDSLVTAPESQSPPETFTNSGEQKRLGSGGGGPSDAIKGRNRSGSRDKRRPSFASARSITTGEFFTPFSMTPLAPPDDETPSATSLTSSDPTRTPTDADGRDTVTSSPPVVPTPQSSPPNRPPEPFKPTTTVSEPFSLAALTSWLPPAPVFSAFDVFGLHHPLPPSPSRPLSSTNSSPSTPAGLRTLRAWTPVLAQGDSSLGKENVKESTLDTEKDVAREKLERHGFVTVHDGSRGSGDGEGTVRGHGDGRSQDLLTQLKGIETFDPILRPQTQSPLSLTSFFRAAAGTPASIQEELPFTLDPEPLMNIVAGVQAHMKSCAEVVSADQSSYAREQDAFPGGACPLRSGKMRAVVARARADGAGGRGREVGEAEGAGLRGARGGGGGRARGGTKGSWGSDVVSGGCGGVDGIGE